MIDQHGIAACRGACWLSVSAASPDAGASRSGERELPHVVFNSGPVKSNHCQGTTIPAAALALRQEARGQRFNAARNEGGVSTASPARGDVATGYPFERASGSLQGNEPSAIP